MPFELIAKSDTLWHFLKSKNVLLNPCIFVSTFVFWQNMWYIWTFVTNYYMMRLWTAAIVSMTLDKQSFIMKYIIKFLILLSEVFWSRAVTEMHLSIGNCGLWVMPHDLGFLKNKFLISWGYLNLRINLLLFLWLKEI